MYPSHNVEYPGTLVYLPPLFIVIFIIIMDVSLKKITISGTFQDGVIPASAKEKLKTLKDQAHELHLRETVPDYLRLRHRLLKYASTVRMVSSCDRLFG